MEFRIEVGILLDLISSSSGATQVLSAPSQCLFVPVDRLEGEGGNEEVENGRCLFSADHHFMDFMFGGYVKVAP